MITAYHSLDCQEGSGGLVMTAAHLSALQQLPAALARAPAVLMTSAWAHCPPAQLCVLTLMSSDPASTQTTLESLNIQSQTCKIKLLISYL